MKIKLPTVLSGRVVALAAILFTIGRAQPGRRLESASDRSLVTVVRVKPEMLTMWLDLQRSAVAPALKKAGVKTRTVYASGVFGEAFEYTIVQPMRGFGEFDSADAQAQALGLIPDPRMSERIRRCVAGASSFLSTALPEISNPGENRNPPLIAFLRLRLAPGKMEEYMSLYKTEVLPALKKADSKVFAASRRLGTDGYDLTFETPLAKFADLDAPPALIRALGPENVARITARLNPLATVVEKTRSWSARTI